MEESTALSPAVGRVRTLCRLLGAAQPILLAGMTTVGTARLAAAVSEAGGLGLVAAGRLTPAAFGAEIDKALALTSRPVGVNIPVVRDPELMAGMIAASLARKVSPIILGGGNPAPWAPLIVEAGRVLGIVTATPQQARKAQALGAQLVVVAGHEAGGKAGADEVGGMVLIPAVVDAVDVPVIAAGGIVDSRTAAAAICLGAAGVQLGTRFMLSEESPLHPETKSAMLQADVSDTMIIARRHNMARRMLVTPAARHIVSREPEASLEEMVGLLSGRHSERGLIEGDLKAGMVACGQGVGRIDQVLPAAEIVRQVAAGIRLVLAEAITAMDGSGSR